ncbi:hypothetical protein BGZ47_007465, partial [Haplosporangium gracile]
MSRPHALELPELLSLISQHLTHKDLYACIRVSHHFHHAFSPHLWSTILIQVPQKPKHLIRIPSKEALTRHRHLIRGLHLLSHFPPHYLLFFQDDTLQELHISTLNYRRYDPRDHAENLQRLMRTVIGMNAGSLRELVVRVALPKEGRVQVNTELWEEVRRCRKIRTLEVSRLDVSLDVLEAFWEICGGDLGALIRAMIASGVANRGRGSGSTTRTQPPLPPRSATMTTSISRSVKLIIYSFDEWPDEVYEDESLTLPAITELVLEFNNPGPRDPMRMSIYGQSQFIRKCIHLRCLQWRGGDSRSDTARTERLNLPSESDVAWFFGGLLGDTPSLQGEYGWKKVDKEDDETEEGEGRPGERWSLPHLESIETRWKDVSDLYIARLLKRLHRLTRLNLLSPHFGPLAFRELVQERVPFRAMSTHQPQDSSSPLSTPTRPLPPPPRRLCITIRVLDVSSSSRLTSDNIFELLESCPALETFSAMAVEMSGILKRNTDWICLKLKHLSLGMIFAINPHTTTSATLTSKEAQRSVYVQLARLQNIKSCRFTYFNTPPGVLELSLSLDYGLDLLSTWGESVEYIQCSYTYPQSITLDDVRWMLDHWPKLKNMFGTNFHTDPGINAKIRELLVSRGIS